MNTRLFANVEVERLRAKARRAAMGFAVVAGMCWTGVAAAETGANKAAADALFAEGRALMTQSKYAQACEKFAESERFEPSVGTSLNLGECHERLGHTASAYGAFGEAKRLATLRNDLERAAVAEDRRVAVEKRLSRLAFSVPANTPGMKVLLDGQELGVGAIGAAIPVDPGPHKVLATAPNRPAYERDLVVEPGPVTIAVEIVFLQDLPKVAQWSTMRSAGVVVGAAGFVGVVAGGVFGVAAIVKNNASKDECSSADATLCSLRGVSLRNQAGTFADVSTGTLLAGGALVGLGVGLFFLGGSSPEKSDQARRIRVVPILASGFGGAMARGEF